MRTILFICTLFIINSAWSATAKKPNFKQAKEICRTDYPTEKTQKCINRILSL